VQDEAIPQIAPAAEEVELSKCGQAQGGYKEQQRQRTTTPCHSKLQPTTIRLMQNRMDNVPEDKTSTGCSPRQ